MWPHRLIRCVHAANLRQATWMLLLFTVALKTTSALLTSISATSDKSIRGVITTGFTQTDKSKFCVLIWLLGVASCGKKGSRADIEKYEFIWFWSKTTNITRLLCDSACNNHTTQYLLYPKYTWLWRPQHQIIDDFGKRSIYFITNCIYLWYIVFVSCAFSWFLMSCDIMV